MVLRVRDARRDDLRFVVDLYNSLVLTTTVAWTDVRQTYEERDTWFTRQQADGFPVLVAEVDGNLAGFAAFGSFRGAGKWPGYCLTVEHTIHVHDAQQGKGIGRALLEALMERARAQGRHVLVAAVDSDNLSSIRFHDRLGFVEVARLPEVGHKFGRWLDLVLMERILDERPVPPAAP
jgi:L-amino acid N-acyltransferase YncA